MKRIIGFVQGLTITKVDCMSTNYLLFYSDLEHDFTDIRSCNISKYGNFFDFDTGDPIFNISCEKDFILVDTQGKEIFNSKNLMEDQECVLQFGIINYELGETTEFSDD